MNKKLWDSLPIVLVISLSLNVFLLFFSGASLKNNAFCAEFKNQASERIRTYYTSGDIDNVYPDEIFYSKKRGSCVVLWNGYESNPAGNGYTITKVIFDAVTNESIFSETFFYFYDAEYQKEQGEQNIYKQETYNRFLGEVR